MTDISASSTRRLGQKLRPYSVWIAIAAIALILRLVLAVQLPPAQVSDAAIYDGIAKSLLSGTGYSIDGLSPTRERPPTYPLFLTVIYAATGQSSAAVLFVQSILGVLTAFLTAWLATRLVDRRAGMVAAFLVATFPALIYYDTRLLREGFTAFLLICTMCLAWRARSRRTVDLLTAGCGLAVISLCRPETLVLYGPSLLIASGPKLSLRRMVRPAALLLIPILAGWGPWTVRNYQVFGSWSPVRAGIVSTIWFGSRWAETGGDDQTAEDRAALKQEFASKVEGAGDAEIEERFKDDLSFDLAGRPFWFVQMVGKKAVMFWRDANGVKRTLPKIHAALPPLLNTYYYGLLALALIGIFAGRHKESVRLLAITIAVYWLTYALLHVRNRYRVPLLPIVFILSSGGLLFLFDRIRTALAPKPAPTDTE